MAKSILSRIEVAYLPSPKKSDTPDLDTNSLLDEVDLREFEAAYQFAIKHKARAFCTYPFLIPFIKPPVPIRLCAVIDFPFGEHTPEYKIFEAGQAFERCKVSECASELDVVLHPHAVGTAQEDIMVFELSGIFERIGLKYIIELGHRPKADIKAILDLFEAPHPNQEPCKCKYIKTNTGKRGEIALNDKLELVYWLKCQTQLPLKISGGIKELNDIKRYDQVIDDSRTIYGVSYSTLKTWKV